MRKKTLVVLALFVALFALVQFAGKGKKAEVLPPLKLSGWAPENKSVVHPTKSAVNVARSPNSEPPYQRIEITRKGKKTVLVRDKEDATIWDIIEPIKAPCEVHRIRSMVNITRNDLESVTSFRLRKGNRARFGLDGPQAIYVRMIAPDPSKSVELIIGTQDRDRITEDGPGAVRTWIHAPTIEPKAVYLIEGLDLRQPFNMELSKFRSKRLLSVTKWSDFDSLKVQNPEAQEASLIHIVRAPTDSDENLWKFQVPEGFTLGSPERIFTSIRGLVAKEIVHRDNAPADTGLDDSSKVATIELVAGQAKASMKVGPIVDDKFWISLAARPDEIYQMPGARRAAILPELSSLREKQIVQIESVDTLSTIKTIKGGRVLMSIRKSDDVWVREDGAQLDSSRTNLLVNTLAKMKAQGFPEGVDDAATGLNNPILQVQYSAQGVPRVLHFGSERDGKVFARVGTEGEVFQVLKYTVDQLSKGWEELRSREIVTQAADQISSLSIVHSDGTQLKVYKAVGEGGLKHWAVDPIEEGQEVDGNKVNALIRTVSSLKVKRFLDGASKQTMGLGPDANYSSVRIEISEKEVIELQVSNRSDADARYVHVVGGLMDNKNVTVASAQLDQLLVQTEALLK